MEFFKKKSLLAMAAMFAASALFVGCGGGGGGGEEEGDVQKLQDWATNLLKVDTDDDAGGFIDKSLTFVDKGGTMTCDAWYYMSEFAADVNASISANGEVSFSATLNQKPATDDGDWPWASIEVAFGEGPLTDDFKILITYTANNPIQLALSDGSKAANNGAGYSTQLAKGTNITKILTKTDFAQPSWAATATPDPLDYELNTTKVESFKFDMGDNYDKTTNIKISRLEAELNWGE